jgi:hypothetical protein
MAVFARHNGMESDQRKSRHIMVEELRAAPAILSMTPLATISKQARMPIIFAMTGHAGRRQLVLIEIAGMAAIASYLRMRGLQRKFRCLAVIESDFGPLGVIVAAFAPGSIPPRMDVLDLVAICALHADSRVTLSEVACGARNGAVRVAHRKPGLVVIE